MIQVQDAGGTTVGTYAEHETDFRGMNGTCCVCLCIS